MLAILANFVTIADCKTICTDCSCFDDYRSSPTLVDVGWWCDCAWKTTTCSKECQDYTYCETTGQWEASGSPSSVLCSITQRNLGCTNCKHISPSKSVGKHVKASTSDFFSSNIEIAKNSYLGITLSWSGSNLDLILYPPYGPKIQLSSNNSSSVTHYKKATSMGYLIKNPISGYWIFEVKPIDVGVNGEDCTMSLYQIAIDNETIQPAINDSHYENTSMQQNSPKNEASLRNLYSDSGIETNGNGKFDFLAVNTSINVSQPGHYSLLGDLYDSNRTKIVWSVGSGSFEVGNQTTILDFNGQTIHKHGANGPYYLKNLVLQFGSSDTNLTLCDVIIDAYVTKFYNYSDFEG